MITYNRLWETMKRKGISQYQLINDYGFSAGQINRLKKNCNVLTGTLETLCQILGCQVEDVIEISFEDGGQEC